MPQNAIIRSDGSGDYTSIIAWEAAEESSDYGSVTVGRVDGYFDQGGTALFLTGFAAHGGRLEAFDPADEFDGTRRSLCGIASSNGTRAIRFGQAGNFEINGLEIVYYGGSGTDRCLEDQTAATNTIEDCLVLVTTDVRVYINQFIFNSSVIATLTASSNPTNGGSSDFNNCNVIGQNSADLINVGSDSFDTVSINGSTGDCFAGSTSNCASTDTTADTLTSIVVADNFVSATPLADEDYRIKSGSPLDLNGIGSFVEAAGGVINVTATLGSIFYGGNPATVSLTGSVDVIPTVGQIIYTGIDVDVGVSGSVDVIANVGGIFYNSNSAQVFITGDVDVDAGLGLISYPSYNTSVDLNAGVNVDASLGLINYTSNGVSVSLTGSIDVSANVGVISYQSFNQIVEVGGVVDVAPTVGAISYSGNGTEVLLSGEIQVTAGLGVINYTSSDVNVLLQGQININASLGQIEYNSNNVTVSVSGLPLLDSVTMSYEKDYITANYAGDFASINYED